MHPLQLDGRFRSPVTLPEYRLGMRPANAGKSYPAEVLTEAEFDRLLGVISKRGIAGKRNRALLALLWGSGLRIAEALALRPKDVDLERGTVTVLHGKGDKRRVLGVPPGAQALLEIWLAERRTLGTTPTQPVFCVISKGRIGRPIHSAYIREAIKDYGQRAGIDKRCHPHGLRHSFAVRKARAGVPVTVIQKMLGHTSLATTERYLDHLDPAEVIAAMRADDWAMHELAA